MQKPQGFILPVQGQRVNHAEDVLLRVCSDDGRNIRRRDFRRISAVGDDLAQIVIQFIETVLVVFVFVTRILYHRRHDAGAVAFA